MRVLALAGGVGGAKLVDGLAKCLNAADLSVVVNTGDDFIHFGLRICPDLDTVCYTLAGLANPETGWGLSGESWNVLQSLKQMRAPTWFKLGDRDLATHLERTRRLQAGETLSDVTRELCRCWGVVSSVLPMCDQPVTTRITLDTGSEIDFQEYFVRLKFEPRVKAIRFVGIENALPAPGVLEAIDQAELIVICPSNPWVSIAPILGLKGIREALQRKKVIAVSPLIGGQALKGPAAKMYREMGFSPSATNVARTYADLLRGFVLDVTDREEADGIKTWGIIPLVTRIIMTDIEDRKRLARELLYFSNQI